MTQPVSVWDLQGRLNTVQDLLGHDNCPQAFIEFKYVGIDKESGLPMFEAVVAYQVGPLDSGRYLS